MSSCCCLSSLGSFHRVVSPHPTKLPTPKPTAFGCNLVGKGSEIPHAACRAPRELLPWKSSCKELARDFPTHTAACKMGTHASCRRREGRCCRQQDRDLLIKNQHFTTADTAFASPSFSPKSHRQWESCRVGHGKQFEMCGWGTDELRRRRDAVWSEGRQTRSGRSSQAAGPLLEQRNTTDAEVISLHGCLRGMQVK